MERMKKLLSSPGARKKNLAASTSQSATGPQLNVPSSDAASSSSATAGTGGGGGGGSKYFGCHLAEIARREGRDVPLLVTKICNYINDNGMEIEGIFRVNGNQKVVEKLRACFDRTGDADLEAAGDVMAVAGLLKLFLREMSDALIPQELTREFVTTQEELHKKPELCLQRLRTLLGRLPRCNYETLKYLMKFLVLVTRSQANNKMSSMALGIVFGPNLFRCPSGFQGLKDQGVTNHIALKFINHYDQLFLEAGETSPNDPAFSLERDGRPRKAPPPRPAPPQLSVNHNPAPVPSPRKNKRSRQPVVGGPPDASGHLEEDEYLDAQRSTSPIVLDGDKSEYGTLISPRMPGVSAVEVEKAISVAVTQHLFGDSGTSSDESLNTPSRGGPVAAPRKKRSPAGPSPGESAGAREEGRPASFKDIISQFEESGPDGGAGGEARPNGRPKKQRPRSQAFEMFEKRGIVIGVAPESSAEREPREMESVQVPVESDSDEEPAEQSSPVAPPRRHGQRKRHASPERMTSDNREGSEECARIEPGSDDSGFGSLKKPQQVLSGFKRAPGPRNRRTPSRHSMRGDMVPADVDAVLEEDPDVLEHVTALVKDSQGGTPPGKPRPFLPETAHAPPSKPRASELEGDEREAKDEVEEEEEEDVNHNATHKPNMGFLDLHRNGFSETGEGSPSSARKPYVPPLDLSILHQHGDGADPILAEEGPSLSMEKAKPVKEHNVLLSPRMSKLKKKDELPDTDVPPSPPTEQTHFNRSRQEDDYSAHVKQLTKRIQSCKKRIRLFEETFEQQHGYRPSQTDKAARPDVKRWVMELAKARKDLRRLKEDIDCDRKAVSPSSETTLNTDGSVDSRGSRGSSSETPVRMDETLSLLLRKLCDKRQDCSRPEDPSLMSRDEVQDEKLAVQKALLYFENIHGRPTTKTERELMRPLYDRYRNVKRLLNKPLSPRDKAKELEPVPEDQTIEFPATPSTTQSSVRDVIRVPTEDPDEQEEDEEGGVWEAQGGLGGSVAQPEASDYFLVTRDRHLLRAAIREQRQLADEGQDAEEGRGASTSMASVSPEGSQQSNLHELSVPELAEEQQVARADKKRLRKILREFEEEFLQQTGRKVQKEDRVLLDNKYQEYKQVKARLKLLEALLSKHDPMSNL